MCQDCKKIGHYPCKEKKSCNTFFHTKKETLDVFPQLAEKLERIKKNSFFSIICEIVILLTFREDLNKKKDKRVKNQKKHITHNSYKSKKKMYYKYLWKNNKDISVHRIALSFSCCFFLLVLKRNLRLRGDFLGLLHVISCIN